MKSLLITTLALLTYTSAFAETACVNIPLTRHEIKMHYIHRICGNVEKAEEGIYKITNINETIGDANTWGMSRFHSKNKICRRLLNAANISDSASYARGSLIMNIDDSGYAMGTAYGIFKSMKEITCYE